MTKDFDEDEVHNALYLHLLWSTQGQQKLILPSLTESYYAYLCDVAVNYGCHIIAAQLCRDHIQMIVKYNPNCTLADLIKTLKSASLVWIRKLVPAMKDVEWQKSDFVFSVGREEIGILMDKFPHAKFFAEEIYSLLDLNQMEYDSLEFLE